MSTGPAGAVHFPHNKNAAASRVILKKDQPGKGQRKVDYKSRKLRHPLRHTDEQEALMQMEMAQNEEKRKFNKSNKDFIRQNKERFVSRDQAQHPPPGGSQIKPGTVTLTQEQLAALLASLGKTADKDHPLKTSIDASNSKIEMENSESLTDTELLKYARLGQNHEKSHALKSNGKFVQDPSEANLSWEEGKQENGAQNVPDAVSWKHMTMGERKRLQWAREKAEAPDDYDPWGRPGAGAPMHRKEEEPRARSYSDGVGGGIQLYSTSTSGDRKQKQELIVNEIERLQKEIREAEKNNLQEQVRTSKGNKQDERGQKNGSIGLDNTSDLNKKEMERKNWVADLDKQRQELRLRKQQEKARDNEGVQDQFADRFVNHRAADEISPRHELPIMHLASHGRKDVTSTLREAPGGVPEASIPAAAMRSAMVTGAGTPNEARYDDARSEEKRRWLEELDHQREEQRLAKMAQKENDKQDAGIWADKYPVDHLKLRQANEILQSQSISPRTHNPVSTQRTSSAPLATVQDPDQSNVTPPSFLRGQGNLIDPVTRKEQEEKRRIQLEYQAQVKAQIDEKGRIKREERERKMREDMEEERKLQMERDSVNRQLEMEQKKVRVREELRQRQMDILKTAVEEAQGKALEDKNVRRIQNLQQRGHDISQLRAAYEASVPQGKDYDTADRAMESLREHQPHMAAPPLHSTYNLDLDNGRVEQNPLAESANARPSYTKEPYIEDRILTPSTYRNLSKPYDIQNSPRREFGTQTLELKDLQAILQSLPDDVQIEYKMKVQEALQEKEKQRQAPTRKVHTKYTEEKVHTKYTDENRNQMKNTREAQPSENAERPLWNQRKRKTVTKNSEKDPFYLQKKKEAEVRREKREKQLFYLQELNKEKIPLHSKSPGRAHCESLEDVRPSEARGRKVVPASRPHGGKHIGSNNRDTSPNILSLLDDGDKRPVPRSHENTGRSSPPIPAVRHRATGKTETDKDPYQYANSYLQTNQTDSKYGDAAVVSAGDEFVPFMRTTEILDPSKADEPVAVSRENSRVERARNAYYGTHHPANKGRKMDVYRDRDRELKDSQNPLFHPGLVSDHPTARQEMILQQLSSLKQTLKQRQKELEDYVSPGEMQEVIS